MWGGLKCLHLPKMPLLFKYKLYFNIHYVTTYTHTLACWPLASLCHLHCSVSPHHPPSALIRRSPLPAVVQRGCSLFFAPLFTLPDSTFKAVLLVTQHSSGWVGVGSSPNLCAHGHDCVAKRRFWLAERKRRMLFFSSFVFHHTQTHTNMTKILYYFCVFWNWILLILFSWSKTSSYIIFNILLCFSGGVCLILDVF